MSEDLRKQLTERLMSHKKLSNRTLSTSDLQRPKPLVAKLSTHIVQSKLKQPLSSYLKKSQPIKSQAKALSKKAQSSRKLPYSLPPLTQQTSKLLVHGDGRLTNEEDLKARTQRENPNTFDIIQTIKKDPELIEDFWYCNPKSDAYDFETVPYKKRHNSDYLTISSRGITHFSKGEAVFLTLEQWEREYVIYQKLKEIQFFKQYRKRKNFSLWKKIRRRNMIQHRVKTLEKDLIFIDKNLRNSLFELRDLCWDVMQLEVVDFNADKPKSIRVFEQLQREKREKAADLLLRIEDEAQSNVANACKLSMEAFRMFSKIQSEEDEIYSFLKGDLSNKQMPYTQESLIRMHYKKLSKFIRLCDFHIIEARLSVSFETMNFVLKSLQVQRKKTSLGGYSQSPLIKIEASFEEIQIFFDPDLHKLKEALNDWITEGLTVLLSNNMLVNCKEFYKYTRAISEYEDRPITQDINIFDIVISSKRTKKLRKQIFSTIESAMIKVNIIAKQFVPLLKIYQANIKMDIETYRNLDVYDIKSNLDDFNNQKILFQDIPNEREIGIFLLMTRSIKEKILPSPSICLSEIHDFLPKISEEKSVLLLKYLVEANKRLRGVPKNIAEYVDQHRNVREIQDEIMDVSDNVNDLKDLMQLMEKSDISFNEHVKRKFQDTLTLTDAVKQKLQSCRERAEFEQIRFTRELREQIINCEKRAVELKTVLDDKRLANKDSSTTEMLEFLGIISENVESLLTNSRNYQEYLSELEMESRPFLEVINVEKDFRRKFEMWKALHDWQLKVVVWNESVFGQIDVNEIETEVDMYYNIAKRSKVLEDDANFVPSFLMSKVETLKNTMPVVLDLRSPCLESRHWEEIRSILNFNIDINDKRFKLKHLLARNVAQVKDKIGEVSLKARKERELKQQLQELIDSWDTTELSYRIDKTTDTYVLSEVEGIISKLEETQVKLNTLLTNRFIGPLFQEVESWCRQFQLFATTFDEWMLCQKRWAELFKIFKNSDIEKKMKDKHKKFIFVDSHYQNHMKYIAEKSSLALPACTKEGLLKNFQDWNRTLEKLQKNLEEYLDKQRIQFPRFYFLSNEELLILLSVAYKPSDIQPFLKNIFDNIQELQFDEGTSTSIRAIISSEKEAIQMPGSLKAKGILEEWLRGLEQAMQIAIKRLIQEALREASSKKELVMGYPSQVVSVTSQIQWVMSIEEALENDSDALSDCLDASNSWLFELTNLIKEELTLHMRRRLMALIIQEVHNRDVIEALREDESVNLNDFKWQKQLRYYWNMKADDCVLRQVDSELFYGYEFLGAPPRLILTSLTDRCWLTITRALKLNLGCNPTGPAGTGKTESIKDLAKAVGRYCIVVNCSDQVTFQVMEKLFTGLCATGSWCCLDEFNRIDIEVLSVIAQQIRSIKNNKDECKQEFLLEDKRTLLLTSMGIFITMNPGYIGRTELPDNLKVLFRPVCMVVPKYNLIAEIMLYAEGFQDAKRLAQKMTQLYKLCSQQLSKQNHYDFGLRAIKSVLNLAGHLKRMNDDASEDSLLIQAMKQSDLPKLLKNDIPLFLDIIDDLFPESEESQYRDPEFDIAVNKAIEDAGLQPEAKFVEKVSQLSDTLLVRYGVMLIGPAGSGKTSAIKTLASTIDILHSADPENHQGVSYSILNPKAVSLGELFGRFTDAVQDWKDGLAGHIIREYSQQEDKRSKWVVFDGPVDSLWVENMNSMLDDNRTLCLVNQERIRLKNDLRVLFEVLDLSAASPATVSRCGMVYLDSDIVSYTAIGLSWVAKHLQDWPLDKKEYVWNLFSNYVPKAFSHLRRALREFIPTQDNSLIVAFWNLVRALTENSVCLSEEYQVFRKSIDKVFVFALVWSMGGALDSISMTRFDSLISKDLNLELPKGSLYDSFVSTTKPGGEYLAWNSVCEKFDFPFGTPFHQIIVPTKDTARFGQLLYYNLQIQQPVFLTGRSGVGKTVITSLKLQSLADTVQSLILNFSAQTTSEQVQNSVLGKLSSKRKDIFGGPAGKKVALLVDDVNMPAVELYGSQPPIELLRQYIDHGFIYEREKKFPIYIQDTTLVCCAGPPHGGRNELSSRFTRHFHVLSIPDTSEECMGHIFKSLLKGFVKPEMTNDILNLLEPMVVGSILCYESASSTLLPTPSKSHYLFNLRDVSKVFQGILMASSIHSPEELLMLWIHEHLRVYADRLTDSTDRRKFCESMIKIIGQQFRRPYEYDELFSKTILFCDFAHSNSEDKEYCFVSNANSLQRCLEDMVHTFNVESREQLDIVMFKDAAEHLCRTCRVLRQPSSNALLLGVNGCGKQVLAKLAAFICNCEVFRVNFSKNYSQGVFREDIKKLYEKAIASPSMLLVNESLITDDKVLEDISNVLNSGDISGMYTTDEIDNIEQKYNIKEYFGKAKLNLHIVLTLDPLNPVFRKRIRMFPAIINTCTIDWYDQWPDDALLNVATKKLKDHSDLAATCAEIHKSVQTKVEEYTRVQKRKVHITPKSYLDMISSFHTLLESRSNSLHSRKRMYEIGIKQIWHTRSEVDNLERSLIALRPLLAAKQLESAELAKKVEEDRAEANRVREMVESEEREVSTKTKEIAELQEIAENDLNQAFPIIEAAIQAVMSISPADIAEIRTFTNPPALALYTLEAVAILLEVPTSWDSIRNMLQQNFLDKLQHYPKDNIKPVVLKKLRTKIESNPQFTPEQVGRHSQAGKSLCQWVYAIETYSNISKQVEPKRQRLEKMNLALREATEHMRNTQKKLEESYERINDLEYSLQKLLEDKELLDQEVQTTNDRLERASVLTEGLKEEAVRWKEKVDLIEEEVTYVVGDSLLGAACLNYFGPFFSDYRKEMLNQWLQTSQDLCVSPQFSLQNFLSDPLEIMEWNLASLPSDATSIENATLVMKGEKWPLMIDPQEQAKKWIKNLVEDLKVSNDTKLLDYCMKEGLPFLLEDASENIHPLNPILNGSLTVSNGRTFLKIGDTATEYNTSFRLFVTTKQSNPDFMPETYIKMNIVNFAVTLDGLTEQLLGDVVKNEAPNVEAKKLKIIKELAEHKKNLRDVEDGLVHSLSDIQGNILDDEILIKKLQSSKNYSINIKKRIESSQKTNSNIEEMREIYRPIARRGSLLYFVIADMASISPTYQFSLNFYTRLFNSVISSKFSEDRLTSMIDKLTETTYSVICRGLFNAHKLLFSFLMAVSLLKEQGKATEGEWDLLLRGCLMIPASFVRTHNPDPSMFTEETWNYIICLQNICPVFNEPLLGVQISIYKEKWKEWIASDTVDRLPVPYSDVSSFHRLMLVKIFKKDHFTLAINNIVEAELGPHFVQMPPVTIEEINESIKSTSPLVFVLSKGADPMSTILRLALLKKCVEKLDQISLGKGQEERAKKALEKGMRLGRWIVLQNCHFAQSWMSDLEKLLDNLNESKIHEDFRLILTSLPFKSFPLLQSAVKITMETPKGLKNILMKSANQLPEHCRKLQFALCFFHTVVQERSKFGPYAWNTAYEFNDSDFEASLKAVEGYSENIPWEAMRYIVGKIFYGGRVTDKFDRLRLSCLVDEYFTPAIFEEGVYSDNLQTFKTYIESLPLHTKPEVFGLHPNADILYLQSESNLFMQAALQIPPKIHHAMSAGLDRDLIVEQMAENFENSLPNPIMITEALTEHSSGDALYVFLLHEIDRLNTVIKTIKQSLDSLRKAIKGLQLMSEHLEQVCQSIYTNSVPAEWASYASLKPLLSWFSNFQARVQFARDWLRDGRPQMFWLGAFIFPQGFLTAVQQNYARKYKCPVDKVSFEFELKGEDELLETGIDGVYVQGLYMEGCRWNFEEMELDELRPGELYADAPVILFAPSDGQPGDPEDYLMPVYKNSQRYGDLATTGHSTSYIISVACQTSVKTSHWVLRGAAFITELSS